MIVSAMRRQVRQDVYKYILPFQNLAAEKTYNNLDVSLREANEHRNEWFEGVQSCKLDETLFTIMERIVRAEVRKHFFSIEPINAKIIKGLNKIYIFLFYLFIFFLFFLGS